MKCNIWILLVRIKLKSLLINKLILCAWIARWWFAHYREKRSLHLAWAEIQVPMSLLSCASSHSTNNLAPGLNTARSPYRHLTFPSRKGVCMVVPGDFSRVEACWKLLRNLWYPGSSLLLCHHTKWCKEDSQWPILWSGWVITHS